MKLTDMKNENDKLIGGVIATTIGCIILGVIYSLVEHSFFSIILFSLVAVGIVVVFVLNQKVWRSSEALENDICQRLNKQGYKFEKKEGTLYVTQNNSHFQVQLADSYNKRIKHLYILYKFRDDDFGKVNMDGWSRAANAININNTETIFVALEDHLCCCYQTSIGNSKDFMNEFDHAYHAIGEAIEDYGKLIPYLERDYPNHSESQTTIGFKQNEQ